MRLSLRMATLAARAALSLPDPVIRAILGAPVQVEGAQLSPTAQLLIALERFVPRNEPQAVPDLVAARRDYDIVSSVMHAGVARDVQVRHRRDRRTGTGSGAGSLRSSPATGTLGARC